MAPIQEGTRCCCKELAVGPPQPLSFTPALQSCISHLPLCTRGTGAGRGPLQKGGGAHWVQGGLAQPWVPFVCSLPCHLSRREISREI